MSVAFEIELTYEEADYLRVLDTNTRAWATADAVVGIILEKLVTGVREEDAAREDAEAKAEYELVSDGIGLPYHDRHDERTGLR